MRVRYVLTSGALVTVLLAGGCGAGGETTAPSPSPAAPGEGGITGPIDRSRDTVDELNRQQEQRDQDTGTDGSGY